MARRILSDVDICGDESSYHIWLKLQEPWTADGFALTLTDEDGFVGSASLGGYVGYRVTWGGTEVQYVMFAGATKVDVSATKDGKTTVESRAGLSSGLGIVTTLKDEFQVGLIVGFDHVGKNSGYQYNGKPWISVSLGYDFVR